MLLLKRGADKQILNNAGQPPNQVAILCGHHQLSSAILRFSDSEIGTDMLHMHPINIVHRINVTRFVKRGLVYARSFKAHFPAPFHSCINRLARNLTICFYSAHFLDPV